MTLTSPILLWCLPAGQFILKLTISCAQVRIVRGPAAQDRVMGMDCLYVNGMLLILLLGLQHASAFYFEAAMLIALFGFVGSTAMAKFLLRGEVIE